MTIQVCNKNEFYKTSPPVCWEYVPCNLCQKDDTESYHRETLPYFDKMLTFQIVRCRHCGLVYTNPRLSDHNATYLLAGCDDPEVIERHARVKEPIYVEGLNEIRTHRRSGDNQSGTCKSRLLDIGCGHGHFLALARREGFEVVGIEAANVPADYAVENFDVSVMKQNILEIDLPDESFDVITAWDVIEHVSDPKAVLQRCAAWLKPDGLLALRFPSARWQKIKAVLLHQMLSSKRAVFGPTMHLYFFNQDTITQMCREAGLHPIRVKTTPAEINCENLFLNGIKVISDTIVRSVELASGRLLGNLEAYCRKGSR
ncbi:MAG: class I SAM-dependent methyltransferase [Sedimentisphaerales bacterium]|nr:class I SAM-dependent methyltransferase [Sedimentisphaerales bacterium]